jgi:hypothetical protein
LIHIGGEKICDAVGSLLKVQISHASPSFRPSLSRAGPSSLL